ncbi:Ig-like domain-containing protein [Ammoniphilus sp. YIM 78166]|uniref:right-handed parallel beta-helix repeat-containing protein n=1 Tax=Ammoniphilus sp. YIM 78166 TaxID=1644106 RepID=UPI00106FC185|nr:Ig-like domain-containing protein [Ammoniphilus sp. YIM 78166]
MKAFTRSMVLVLSLLLVMNSFSFAVLAEEESAPNLVWESVTFGQSTDLNFASNVLPEKVGTNYVAPEFPGTIDGRIVVESRGGKLAPGHDGLTFYYTTLDPRMHNFVLEADLIVEQFGPETGAASNSQDSAGIMVRDVNGGARQDPMMLGYEEVPAASNIFGVGMMRHGISPIYRTGVEYPWGNLGSQLNASAFTTDKTYTLPIGTPVRVKLERTDTEFIMSATFTHAGEPKTFEKKVDGADWVQSIDPTKMHVGFYAARNAKIAIENAELTLTEANTVPRTPVEVKSADAVMNVVSASTSGSSDYTLKALANYDGVVSVSQDGASVVNDAAVKAGEVYSFKTTLERDTTDFSVTYTPNSGPTTTPITKTLNVTKKIYNSGAGLYVSPNGTTSAAGTIEDPMNLEMAIQYVLPGETIFMRGGTYEPSSMINIKKEYSGEPGRMKTLAAYNGEKVIIDGQEKLSNVLQLNADYWHVVGLEITKAASTGMRLNGDHNIVELMVFNYNKDTGLHIAGSGSDPNLWPKYNLIQHCESHDNRDDSNINADGFAAKLGVGVGNVFRGNIAHHNIDDGWDLYNRTNEGANMPVTLEGNIAYSNGKLSNGFNKDGNTGNGFKVGGEGLPVAHILRNNIAFDNNMDGFTDNFNPGQLVVENNVSFNNKRFNYIFRLNPYFTADEQGVFKNNVSLKTRTDSTVKDFISGNVDETNFFFDGEKTVNNQGVEVTVSDFVSVDMPASFEREPNGEIAWGEFLRISADSVLRSVGGGFAGALPALESIEVDGAQSLKEGESGQLTVKASYSDGSVKVVNVGVSYSSSLEKTATVDSAGLVQAVKSGETVITVRYQGLTVEYDLHVRNVAPGLTKKVK